VVAKTNGKIIGDYQCAIFALTGRRNISRRIRMKIIFVRPTVDTRAYNRTEIFVLECTSSVGTIRTKRLFARYRFVFPRRYSRNRTANTRVRHRSTEMSRIDFEGSRPITGGRKPWQRRTRTFVFRKTEFRRSVSTKKKTPKFAGG